MNKLLGDLDCLDDMVEKSSYRYSMDTCSSLAGENHPEGHTLYDPEHYTNLFQMPSLDTSQKYELLFQKIEKTAASLHEVKQKFDIRDDLSIQPKVVILRNVNRRRTAFQSVTQLS